MIKAVDYINRGSATNINPINSVSKEFNNISVLFVDDDFVNFTYFRDLINEIIYNIFRAVSLKQALQMLADSQDFTLIILSASLPENFNNFAIRSIKTRYPSIPVIATVNNYNRYLESDLLKAGSNICISRYIDRDHLVEVFKETIEFSRNAH